MNNKLNNCKKCVWSVLVRGLGGGRWFRGWVTLRREVCPAGEPRGVDVHLMLCYKLNTFCQFNLILASFF